MTDYDLEQRLRGWYRAEIDDRESAPFQLRGELSSFAQSAPTTRRALVPGWRFPAANRFAPLAVAATAVVIAIIVGIGLLVRPPSVGPSPTHHATPDATAQPAAWVATGRMNTARGGHTATLLEDGRVLVTGGSGAGNALASAELYDPVSGTWTPAADMTEVGFGHTATLLADGEVLVVGGAGNSGDGTTSAELYDPSSGTWTATGRMIAAHSAHTATLLPDGRVLVVGGIGGDALLATAELYDPSSGTWTATGAMTMPRHSHAATLLGDGRVLVVGGCCEGNDDSSASAELYDPAADTWTAAGSMSQDRSDFAATALPDGTVLVTGGAMARDGAVVRQLASAELYDPATGTWNATGNLHIRGRFHTDTVLSDGRILVTGGQTGFAGNDVSASADLYGPMIGIWTATAAMAEARSGHTATLLLDGRVLVAGGGTSVLAGEGSVSSSAELYDAGSGS